MLNRRFVLLKLNKYLNSAREISAEEFDILFAELTKKEQYEVIRIMIEEDIQYVDEKTPEETEEEITLAQKSGYSLKQEDYLSFSSAMLCKLYQEGNSVALEALIKKNERFVQTRAKKFASKFIGNKLGEEDLYQEGILGLIRAAQKFDTNMDNAFLTYADSWIIQSISRAIFDTGFTIRLPVHMFERIFRVVKIKNLQPNLDNISLTKKINELYPNNYITVEQVKEALKYAEIYLNTISLNIAIGEEEESELIEFIQDETNPNPYERLEISNVQENLKKTIFTLQPREILVVLMRYGFWSGEPMTLEDIGKNFGLTRERIRQIEVKALRKLRNSARTNLINNFYGGN